MNTAKALKSAKTLNAKRVRSTLFGFNGFGEFNGFVGFVGLQDIEVSFWFWVPKTKSMRKSKPSNVRFQRAERSDGP